MASTPGVVAMDSRLLIASGNLRFVYPAKYRKIIPGYAPDMHLFIRVKSAVFEYVNRLQVKNDQNR